jgi:hypothetical protein
MFDRWPILACLSPSSSSSSPGNNAIHAISLLFGLLEFQKYVRPVNGDAFMWLVSIAPPTDFGDNDEMVTCIVGSFCTSF